MRRVLVRLVAAAALLATVLPLSAATAIPAAAGPTFGSDPLDDVLHWAGEAARCGLTTNKLAAMMLAPTYPETGTPSGSSPSPMTLSRWDNQTGLHSFGNVSGQPRAFWHPGVGAWQFDSAGLGAPFTAAQRIDTYVVAAQAAATMAARWCTNKTLAYVWAPWYGCGSHTCKDVFDSIYRRNGDRLVNVSRDTRVHSRGGMERHTCTGAAQSGPFTCWRVDPARAEGHAAFAAAGYGPAPITAPFYVYAANGKEYRHWLRADTGYRRGVWATRPLGSNARTSLVWHHGDGLVDRGLPGRDDGGGGGGGDDDDDDDGGTGGGAGFSDVPLDAWYLDALTWAIDGEVVTGFDGGTFRPAEPVNRAQVVVWLWTMAGEPQAARSPGFTDVPSSAWYADAVAWAVGEGLVTGFADRTYRPTEPVNRAQLASMLWNLADRPVPSGPVSFTDVRSSAWYRPAVAWLTEMGYASGFPNGTFRPLGHVGRAQGVSWLYAARQFDDVATSSWYATGVDWARYRKVVDGFADHTFRGGIAAKRIMTVDLLWQMMDAPTAAPHGFSDVPPGNPAVSWAAAGGVVTGFRDGSFRPDTSVSRAQAVMMLWAVAGRPSGGGTPPFTDVAADAWFVDGLAWAAAQDLVTGFADRTFRPNAPVSRAQITMWASALAHTDAAWAPGAHRPSTVVFAP